MENRLTPIHGTVTPKDQQQPEQHQEQKGQEELQHCEKSASPINPIKMLGRLGIRMKTMLSQVTVEPVMFLIGTCHWSMQVFMEVVQMNKVCLVGLGYSEEVCANLSAYPEENIAVQKDYSVFFLQNSIIMSVLSLIFVLFMGAWSDKYGRKIPLVLATLCHALWSGGYLLNSWQSTWPMEMIYLVTFLDAVGGGAQGVVSTSVAYISDVSPIESRTTRVSTAMSLWYFGGPLGNLVGAVAIQVGGINLAIGIAFVIHVSTMFYTVFYVKESHGPFAVIPSVVNAPKAANAIKKEDVTTKKMLLDLFNWRRPAEAFRTAFRSREGNARAVLLAVIFSNMVRRAAKAFFMYLFVRQVLGWDAAIYTYWMSYRTLIAALGSLVLVPLITKLISITDPMWIVVGSLALVGEWCCFGFVIGPSTSLFIWLGPLAGLLTNTSMIAQKSLSTKLVSPDEKGRVSAVMSATQSLMPSVGYGMYAVIYNMTIDTFPEAQFFFGASLATIIMILFLAIQLSHITPDDKESDPEKDMSKEEKTMEDSKPKESLKATSVSEIKKNPPTTSTEPDAVQSVALTLEPVKPKYIECSHSLNNQTTKEPLGVPEDDSPQGQNDRNGITCYESKLSDAEILESEKSTAHSSLGNDVREADQRDKRR